MTVHTVFHRTHVPLQKWFVALNLTIGSGNRISAAQIARCLGLNKNTAGRMVDRISMAMMDPEQRRLMVSIVDGERTGGNHIE